MADKPLLQTADDMSVPHVTIDVPFPSAIELRARHDATRDKLVKDGATIIVEIFGTSIEAVAEHYTHCKARLAAPKPVEEMAYAHEIFRMQMAVAARFIKEKGVTITRITRRVEMVEEVPKLSYCVHLDWAPVETPDTRPLVPAAEHETDDDANSK